MSSARPSAVANLRGVFAMLVSQAVYLLSDSIIKLAGTKIPANQIMAVRGLMAVYLAAAVLVATVDLRKWYLVLNPYVVLRAAAEGAIAVFFLAALQHLQLGVITVITQVTPLIMTVTSALLLGERVGFSRWAAVGVGFVGGMLVTLPEAGGFGIHIIEALMVALLTAARDLITRFIRPDVPTNVVTFASTLAVCLMGFFGFDQHPWVTLSTDGTTYLAASAILVTLGVWFMVMAFRDVEVSVVSPFRYSAVAWAVLYGYLIWNDRPSDLALLGTVLIVVSGIYAMIQEARSESGR